MKRDAIISLKKKLSENQSIYGLWVTMESASITEIAVALNLDFVVVDMEHGHLGWSEALEHIRAAVRSATVVLVRIPELQKSYVKKALDSGADGIVIPNIETAEELTLALSYARYPPEGSRGMGIERATGWGHGFPEHVQASADLLVIPMIESTTAGKNIVELASVSGTDIFFFGTADFTASAGYPGQLSIPAADVQIDAAREALLQSKKSCGIVATTAADITKRQEQGYRMFAIGFDSGILINGIKQVLSGLKISSELHLPS